MDAVLVLRTRFSFVVAMTDASVMILLWKACCTWKAATALMSSVCEVQYHFSFWRWKSSFIYPLLIETWSSLQLISNILFHRVKPSCIIHRQSSVIVQHTDCNLLSSLQIHPIQYQCPLLLFQKMWSLIGDAALSETGVFSFPLHSELSISAGQQQTCKH